MLTTPPDRLTELRELVSGKFMTLKEAWQEIRQIRLGNLAYRIPIEYYGFDVREYYRKD